MTENKLNIMLQRSIRHFENNRLSDARNLLKKIIQIKPNQPDAFHLLGIIANQSGEQNNAIMLIRKAIKLNPKIELFYRNLALILISAGKNTEAISALKKAIHLNRNNSSAHNDLGTIYSNTGKTKKAIIEYQTAIKKDENNYIAYNNLGKDLSKTGSTNKAINYFKKSISINPKFHEAYFNLALTLKETGEITESINTYKKGLKINQYNDDAYNNFGNALMEKGDLDAAIAAYKRAIEINPKYENSYNGLGHALYEKNEFDQSMAIYKCAIEINQNNFNAHNGLGDIFKKQGEHKRAITSYKRAIQINPNNYYSYNGIGNTLSDLGKFDDAITAYRKAIKLNPKHTEALRAISKNKKFLHHDDKDIQLMESLYANNNISDKNKIHLAFALGKAYEDLGEFHKSFEFIIAANKSKHISCNYNKTETEELFENIKTIFSTGLFNDNTETGNKDPSPIFVLGMPRSGTSLVEQIIASHPDVFGAGELHYLPDLTRKLCNKINDSLYPSCITQLQRDAFEELGTKYIQNIRNNSKKHIYIIDKMPYNFMHIGLIKLALPNAKVIHCAREPLDNCLSIFKNYFTNGHQYSYDMREIGHFYKLYAELMKHWHHTLPDFIFNIYYEELISNQKVQTETLLNFCNLSWDASCLDFHKTKRAVGTLSNAQVRSPIYKSSVQIWKRYKPYLAPLIDSLK